MMETRSPGLTDFFYDMYERYHSEALENAFEDIDAHVAKGAGLKGEGIL